MTGDGIAGAQAARDRQRLAASRAEAAALRRRVWELENSPSRRLLTPLRRVAQLVRGGHSKSAAACPAPARGFALVVDNEWPQPDRDSGSVDIVMLMQALQRLGFDAVLAAVTQHDGQQPARDRLLAAGVRCLLPAEAPSVADWVSERGRELDLCVLCRVFCGGALLELVQLHCPYARIVFDTIDLNFVREERRARLLGDAALLAMADALRAREEHVVRSSDATMVVSATEAALLAERLPDSLVAQMPLARDIRPPARSFADRRGIGFIGGFAHAPNVDAIRHFLSGTWPLAHAQMPGCALSVVGADAPADLADGAPGEVRVLGHLPDAGPWFESLRATVAPLRFGAGAKGKVASSLAAGVPCVASPVAAEGMGLSEADGVLVAADPASFAAAITRVCTDEALWRRLSAGALDYAGRELSPAAWQARLDVMLRRIGV